MKSLRVLLCSVLAVGLAAPVVARAACVNIPCVEETAPATTNYPGTATITYTGKWHQTEVLRNWSGGTAAVSPWGPGSSDDAPIPATLPAAQVTLSFSGTGVSWIGARGPQTGIANVYLDGIKVATVDTVSPDGQEHLQQPLFTSDVLPAGIHTLAIEVTGTPTTRPIVVVDAFDVTP